MVRDSRTPGTYTLSVFTKAIVRYGPLTWQSGEYYYVLKGVKRAVAMSEQKVEGSLGLMCVPFLSPFPPQPQYVQGHLSERLGTYLQSLSRNMGLGARFLSQFASLSAGAPEKEFTWLRI